MPDYSIETKLNENNLQATFQYKPNEDEFELKEVEDSFTINRDNPRVKYFEGQNLFCVDLGYSIDGDLYKMDILVDNVKIYPVKVFTIEEIAEAKVDENNFLVVANDLNFKSVIFLPTAQLNKLLYYKITTYASVFSSWMFDEIAKKLNSLDINYPVRNLHKDETYKIGDIVKNNGYLYKVIKSFLNNIDDDRILLTNSIILTPFKRLKNGNYKLYDLLEKDNNFFVCQKDFTFEENKTILSNYITPLVQIIEYSDNLTTIYKNTLLIKKDGDAIKKYLVLNETLVSDFDSLIKNKNIIELYTAKDITYNNAEADNLQSGLDLAFNKIMFEKMERAEKDAELEDKINQVEIDYKQADTELETKITDNTNNLNKEIQDRTDADTVLQNNIDTEEAERTAKDTELEGLITKETTERKTEDTNIKNSIGDLNTLKTTKKDNIVNAINEVNDKAEAGGGGSTVNIVDTINKNDTRKDVVPNPFAVNSFVMSLIPIDIVSDKEFDTGKTIDGKKIYGYYAKTYPFVNQNVSVYNWIATIPFGVSLTTSNNEPSAIRLPMQCMSGNIQDGVYYIEFSGFTRDDANQNYKSAYCEMRYLPIGCDIPSSWFNGFIFYTKD